MDNTNHKTLPNICSKMTQIEADLKMILYKIFAQADNHMQLEKQEKYNQEIAITKQVVAKVKNTYGCILNS
jgi:hypothetical protein